MITVADKTNVFVAGRAELYPAILSIDPRIARVCARNEIRKDCGGVRMGN